MYMKKIMFALMASAILASALPVEAGIFGQSATPVVKSSSFSSSKSTNSTSSSTSSNNGGISQGSSIGMSRANVANSVKNGSYSAPANGTTVAGSNPGGSNNYGNSNSNYGNNNYGNNGYNNGYNNGQSQGHSTGTVLGAAAAGAAAGYMLGNHNNNTVVVPGGYNNGYNNGGQVIVDNGNGGYVNGGNGPVVVSSGFGFGSMIWSIIKVLVVLIVLFIIVRVIMSLFANSSSGNNFSSSSTPVFNGKTPEDEIRDMKEQFFINFQKNNRPSGLEQIRSNSTTVFYEAVEDMVRGQSESRVVKVRQIESELVDVTQDGSRYVASVRYHAVVEEGDNGAVQSSDIKELWNFVYEHGAWKLAGIDQL